MTQPTTVVGDQPTTTITVYQWDYTVRSGQALTEQERKLVTDFLRAHGISEMVFFEGSSLYVRAHEDGSLWLHTWRGIGNDIRSVDNCPYCPQCIKQEPVVVPLVAPVPMVGDAYLSPTTEVPSVWPAHAQDPETAGSADGDTV